MGSCCTGVPIRSWAALAAAMVMSVWLNSGCIGKRPANPAATQPVTNIDPQLATSEYWLKQPAVATVDYGDLTALWDAAEATAKNYLFSIDRRDLRSGTMTTVPMVSKQWFEPLRKDGPTTFDVKEASLGTIRRTIYFQFDARPEGGYRLTPKVIVERESKEDSKYREPELNLPTTYWYALRRDTAMEERLAQSIRERLAAH